MQNFLANLSTGSSDLLIAILGLVILAGFYFGKGVKYLKLPSIIGFMIIGLILGPGVFNILTEHVQRSLDFISQIALGFVALTIGLELDISHLKTLGIGIIYVILCESFGAFILVFIGIYFLTKNIPLALAFASVAPASAPAGTVAVIQEYRARGPLTKTLYAVVGFDDGLGIIIFGFAESFSRTILISESGKKVSGMWHMLKEPFIEILLSFIIGLICAVFFSLLARKLREAEDLFILIVGITFIIVGLCPLFHVSLILTNMVVGLFIVNTQPHALTRKLHKKLPDIMPLLFILFFALAGAHLDIGKLPSLGLIGIIYIITRSAGLISGASLGATLGKMESKIRKYTGLGILSQAGVAIGLSLILKEDFKGLGKVLTGNTTSGDYLGSVVITTITATCIFFEIIGPILTKIALTRAGEIKCGSAK